MWVGLKREKKKKTHSNPKLVLLLGGELKSRGTETSEFRMLNLSVRWYETHVSVKDSSTYAGWVGERSAQKRIDEKGRNGVVRRFCMCSPLFELWAERRR